MNKTDEELVELIKQRNQRAFCKLVDRYGGLIHSIVHYHLKSISMWQEDCVNDILFAIWQNIDRFDSEKNTLKNWIGAISKYRAINYKRRFYRRLTEDELKEDITDGKEIDEKLLAKELEEETESLLSALAPIDREIFIRRYMQEASPEEIAQDFNQKPSWIYNRISRGRKKLRNIYAGKG